MPITMHLDFRRNGQPAVQTPGLNAVRLPSDASVSALPWAKFLSGHHFEALPETTNTLPFDRSGCATSCRTRPQHRLRWRGIHALNEIRSEMPR